MKEFRIRNTRRAAALLHAILLALFPGMVRHASADTTINIGTNPDSDTFVIPFI